MPLCFRNFIPYAVPGVLALPGCWWIYSHRKKHGTYQDEQAVATEEQQEEVTEQDSAPRTEPCVPQRPLSLMEEEYTENETSTSLLTAGLMMPSVMCHADERLDLSQDLPVTTNQPSTLEDDSEKLEEMVSQDKSGVPACVSLPWESACSEQPGEEDVSRSVASTVPACQEEEDTQPKGELRREKIRGVGLCKEDIEKIEQVTIQIVSKVILAATEEVLSAAASDGSTRICQAAASRVETPLETARVVSSDQMLAEEAPVARENVKSDAVVPTSLQAEEQGQNVTRSSCLIRICLPSPEQGDTKDCWKKNPVCSEGVLPASVGDGSTQLCEAAVSQAETPLEMASAVSTDQTLAEEAPAADKNTAGKKDAAVLTSPQTEEEDQNVTCSSCLTQSPTEGATTDCQMKTSVCSESQGGGRTPVENHKGSPEKSPLVREGSACSTSTCEGGACVEGLLQNTRLAVASGQHSESLSVSATRDTSAGHSCGPSETQPTLKLPEDNEVPCSNGVLREDGPDLCNECSKAAGIDGDCPQDERLDLSQDLPVTTNQPSTLEDDSEKLEEMVSQDKSGVPACVSLPWESACSEQPGEEDVSRSVASTVPVCQEEEDTQPKGELRREKIRGVGLCKEDIEKIEQVTIQIVSKVILAAAEEVLSAAASDGSTRICQAAASRVETPLETARVVSSDQMLAEEAPVARENVKSDAVVPTSLQAEEQGQNVTRSSCLIRICLPSPEQGDTKDCWKKNPVCSEGVLPASVGDGSTQLCEAAVSQAETPLEMASAVSTDQTLAEEAPAADKNTAGKKDAAVLTSPQTEEEDQNVTCSSCLTQSPTEGATTDCQMKTSVCSESQGGGRTPVENHKGSPEKSPLVREGSACSTSTCEGGACVEGLLQNTRLAVASGQHSESLSVSATRDTSAGHSCGPSETQPTLKLPEDNEVPCSNGVLREDGPDLCNECSKAAGIDGDCPQGLDEHGMDFVNSGCAMKKAVTQQNTKKGRETSKCDHVIWEIEVPKELVGHLIGRQGKYKSFLRQRSGAKIYVLTQPYFHDSQVCHIEVGIICAAPGLDGAWLRAQVISYFEETSEVELRYVDYGGYDKVKVDTLRQIRSDFLSLPFQGAEVLLDNVVPLPDEDHFSPEADAAVDEMTRGAVLVAQVTNYDSATGLPLIQLWNLTGDEVVSINRTLVERGLARWLDY